MKMKWMRLLAVLLLVSGLWFGYVAACAYLNLVTLDVHDADVREVIRKMEWQSWRSILVHREVRGRVTLEVRHAHLEEVLGLIAQQTDSRWLRLYALCSSGKSLSVFERAACGEIAAEAHGWSNLAEAVSVAPGGFLAGQSHRPDQRVTLNLTNQDLALAMMALSRFGNIKVVADDGAPPRVSLRLNQATIPKAVRQLGKETGRKSASYYALLLRRAPPPMPERTNLAGAGEIRPPPPPQPPSPEQEQQREQAYEALREILPPEQRAELEREHQFHEALHGLSPWQQMQYLQAAQGAPQLLQQRLQELKTSTPEQRVNRDREDEQRRQSNAK